VLRFPCSVFRHLFIPPTFTSDVTPPTGIRRRAEHLRLPFATAFCPGGRDELGQFVIVFCDLLVYDNRCPLSGSSRYVGNCSGNNGPYRGENHEDLYPGVTTGSQWRPPPGGEVRAEPGIGGLCESHNYKLGADFGVTIELKLLGFEQFI